MSDFRARSVSEIIDASVELYRRNFTTFWSLALLGVIPGLLNVTLLTQLESGMGVALIVILAIAGAVISTIAYGAITVVASNLYLNRPVDIGGALRQVTKRFWALLAVSLILGLVVSLGFLFLIIPGFIALARFYAAPTALLIEGVKPEEAMSRSNTLSKGNSGKVLMLLFASVLLMMIVYGGLSFILMLGLRNILVANAASTFLLSLATPFLPIVITVLYYDLRIRNEGYDLELMAQRTGTPINGTPLSA